VVLQQQCYYYY